MKEDSFAFSNVGAPGRPGSCRGGRCFGALKATAFGSLTCGPREFGPHVSDTPTAPAVKSLKLLFGSAGHRWVASVN